MTDLPRIASEIESKLIDFRTTSENIQAVTEKIENLGKTDTPGPSEVQKVEVAQPGLLSSVAANAPDAAARGLFTLLLLLFLMSSGDLFYAKIVRAVVTSAHALSHFALEAMGLVESPAFRAPSHLARVGNASWGLRVRPHLSKKQGRRSFVICHCEERKARRSNPHITH